MFIADDAWFCNCKPCPDFARGDIAAVAPGWLGAGREMTVLGPPLFKDQWWVPVHDPDDPLDGHEDPTFHRASGLVLVRRR
jgi:hypothetical protein